MLSRITACSLFVLVGCTSGPTLIDASSNGSPCSQAAAHLATCTGAQIAVDPQCDEMAAASLLDTNCAALVAGLDDSKSDGGFLANMACRLGVLSACEVDYCETPVAEGIETSCAAAIGTGDCAECDFYDCLELSAGCGQDAYLVGYAGDYCKRFAQVTTPRVSPKAQQWLDSIRVCLIQRMDDWYQPGASCEAISERGYQDHNVCYLQTGFCELSLKDWWTIVATVRPGDLPLRNLLEVGKGCLKQWTD